MSFMRRLGRVISFSNAAICIAMFAWLTSLLAEENRWDPLGAARAFEDARRIRNELSKAASPTLEQYLECVRTYRSVHIRDPHFSRTGDAIYEEGLTYQEMGNKFASNDFYKTAIKRYQLLIRDYGGNQNCPEALLRIGDIFLKPLNDEAAAQSAYQFLKANYGRSIAVGQLASGSSVAALPSSKPVAPAPPSRPAPAEFSQTDQAIPKVTTSIQSIRHWSTVDYTRVIIDLDSTAVYSKRRLSNPDRIYFDISGAKLSSQLGAKSLAVGDEFLQKIRISQNTTQTVRVVLDLATKSDQVVSEMHDPFRIVIDLRKPGATNSLLRASSDAAKASHTLASSKPDSSLNKRDANSAKSLAKPKQTSRIETATLEKGLRLPPRAITDINTAMLKTPAQAAPQTSKAASSKSAPQEASAKDFKPKETAPAPVNRDARTAVSNPIIAGLPSSVPNAVVRAQKDKAALIAPGLPQNGDGTAKVAANSISTEPVVPRPADPTALGNRTLIRMLGLKIGRIVLDPGHGGHDLGTVGPGGLLEKDLVLSIALDLQKLLEDKLGAQVILTRTDDTFITLEERSAIANRFQADLFISIHANSSRSRSVSGVETYYLNFARTEAEREIASRENATSSSNISELEDLIKRIAQADKSSESRELASIIQKMLFSGVRTVFPKTQNRGVRSAPFIVLVGASMPSILTEIAFISNPRDERLLKKPANQERLVKALFSGIEGYMKTLGSDVAQNQRRTD